MKENEVWKGVCITDGAGMARTIHGLQLSQNRLERYPAVQEEKPINTKGINLTRVFVEKGIPL